jgi:peptidoglycan/LPS O-acetylase OafA/YrhL|tara:strand:+ start:5 stop:1102 length:1098 start_codon:yes stop_codon:yes gene_type:complete
MDKRFFNLDFLRGSAALFVVIWHYRHFFYESNVLSDNFNAEKLPLYWILQLPYNYGGLAVEFFFCLSGFIFFQYYFKKILLKEIGLKEFFLRRFFRLYPVFIFSLLLTVLLIFFFQSSNDSFFVYKYNDFKHFILNIFLVHQWGFQDGWSFNGPSWSISVEWFLYFLFFFAVSLRSNIFVISLAIIFLGFLLFPLNSSLGRGVILFFFSSFIWYLVNNETISQSYKNLLVFLYIIFSAFFIFFLPSLISVIYPSLTIFVNDKSLYELFFIVGFVPSIVYFGAILKFKTSYFNNFCDYFGQLSYPIYLFHFPIQLFLVSFGFISDPYSISSLLIYLASVFLISFLFSEFIEKPLTDFLKNKFLSKK